MSAGTGVPGTPAPLRRTSLLGRVVRTLGAGAGLELLRQGGTGTLSAESYHALIDVLEVNNMAGDAVRLAAAAASLFPDDPLFPVKNTLYMPALYRSEVELEGWRARIETQFTVLEADFAARLASAGPDARTALLSALAQHTTFFLAYQGKNDRDLQRRFACLVTAALSSVYPEWVCSSGLQSVQPGDRFRVGFISSRFRHHSVSKSHAGWILNRDPAMFELYGYQIEGGTESETLDPMGEEVRGACDHFRVLSGSFRSITAAIRADNLHVAVFLDVGMLPRMTLLSCLRLAPLQCATWGHPVTTGSPSMDYYFSSELMEPASGDLQYTESLVRLPGIGVCYRKPEIPDLGPEGGRDAVRARFGIRGVGYLCSQSAHKYLPRYDDLLPAIAKRVPAAQFVFVVSNAAWQEDLNARFQLAFARAGLHAADHCIFQPALSQSEFLKLNLAADVYLDTPGWNGFNTTMEAIACGLPVVTLPGDSMRGRHGYAILSQLGVSDTIAADEAGYVAIAARLALDPAWKSDLCGLMHLGHERLYNDIRSVRAVEAFLLDRIEGLCRQRAERERS